jgi:hypothetical protein
MAANAKQVRRDVLGLIASQGDLGHDLSLLGISLRNLGYENFKLREFIRSLASENLVRLTPDGKTVYVTPKGIEEL